MSAPIRLCEAEDCDEEITHLAPQARFHSHACGERNRRLQLSRDEDKGVREPRPIRSCDCPGPTATEIDPDGDALCLACGRFKSLPASRVNGYDERMAEARRLMQPDGYVAQHRSHLLRPQIALRTRIAPSRVVAQIERRLCSDCGAVLRTGNPRSTCAACSDGGDA